MFWSRDKSVIPENPEGLAGSILPKHVAVWLNRDSFFQAFVAERRAQWNIEKQLNKLENRISSILSNNPTAIGSILLKNDYVLKERKICNYGTQKNS